MQPGVDELPAVHTDTLTGDVATQTSVPTKMMQPSTSNVARRRGVLSFVLIPPKKSAIAKSTTAKDVVRRALDVTLGLVAADAPRPSCRDASASVSDASRYSGSANGVGGASGGLEWAGSRSTH